MLEVKNLYKYYGQELALDDVNFLVEKGEVVGFLGPNGAGKTTTMRIITNCLYPEQGEVIISGDSVQKSPQNALEKVGYLPENNPLYPNYRVDDFLKFIIASKGSSQNEINQIIEALDIKSVLFKKIKQLSKGYRQRVGLAQALLGSPDLLILDEPTSGLDPKQKKEMLQYIKEYARKGKTILFSSHILSEVASISDKLIIIHQGKIQGQGSVASISKRLKAQEIIIVKSKTSKTKLEKALAKIKIIDHIKQTQRGKHSSYEIYLTSPDEDILEKISMAMLKAKLPVLELREKSIDLQDIFEELTK